MIKKIKLAVVRNREILTKNQNQNLSVKKGNLEDKIKKTDTLKSRLDQITKNNRRKKANENQYEMLKLEIA